MAGTLQDTTSSVVLALVSVAVWVDRLRPKDAGSAHAEHVP